MEKPKDYPKIRKRDGILLLLGHGLWRRERLFLMRLYYFGNFA
jgi:hypothetical protein